MQLTPKHKSKHLPLNFPIACKDTNADDQAGAAAAGGVVCDSLPAVVRPGLPGVQQCGVKHHYKGKQILFQEPIFHHNTGCYITIHHYRVLYNKVGNILNREDNTICINQVSINH